MPFAHWWDSGIFGACFVAFPGRNLRTGKRGRILSSRILQILPILTHAIRAVKMGNHSHECEKRLFIRAFHCNHVLVFLSKIRSISRVVAAVLSLHFSSLLIFTTRVSFSCWYIAALPLSCLFVALYQRVISGCQHENEKQEGGLSSRNRSRLNRKERVERGKS